MVSIKRAKIGDRVRLLCDIDEIGIKGQVVKIVEFATEYPSNDGGDCPLFLETVKGHHSSRYAPFRRRYELINNTLTVGGKLIC